MRLARFLILFAIFLCFIFALDFSGIAFAASDLVTGLSEDGQLLTNTPYSPIMEGTVRLHNLFLVVIAGIAIFVTILMCFVCFRFYHKRHPVPSGVTHNVKLEVIWTVAPVIILLILAFPSFRLIELQRVIPDGDKSYYGEVLPAPTVTIKVIGAQWYWSYSYRKEGKYDFAFDSYMLDEKDRAKKVKLDVTYNYPRLLSVDNEMVVPVNETVRLIITSNPNDVIHSFALPSLGIKVDAIPGRNNETWFLATKRGIYYGQCSELCGKDHSFMPIAVKVVSRVEYDAWLMEKQADIGETVFVEPDIFVEPDTEGTFSEGIFSGGSFSKVASYFGRHLERVNFDN